MSQSITLPTSATDLIVAGTTTTGDVSIGDAQTSGAMTIGTSVDRTANVTIGNASATGTTIIKGVDMKVTKNFDFNTVTMIGSTGGSFTHTPSTGTWIRWGNLFQFNFTLQYSDKGTATGFIMFGGFPYLTDAELGAVEVHPIRDKWAGLPASRQLRMRTSPGETELHAWDQSSGVLVELDVATVDTSGIVEISGIFFVD